MLRFHSYVAVKKVLIIYSIIAGMGLHAWGIDDNPPLAIGLITGSVIDATSGEPMSYVNVVVRNSSDSILTGGITDEKGNFVIVEIPEGNNKVEILFMGYEKITREVDFSHDNSKHNRHHFKP